MPPVEAQTPLPVARKRHRGKLVAIALAVAAFVVALLYSGLPRWRQHERELRARTTAAAVQNFVAAFESFAAQHGEWPPAAAPGDFPKGMDSLLRDTGWTNATPIGGKFVWLIDAGGVHAGISIVPADPAHPLDSRDVEQLLRALKSDHFPATRFRRNERNEPMFVLED